MRCDNVIELFSRYREADLDPAARGELEAHLAACDRCREEFASLDAICATLRELRPEPAPAGLARAVRARLDARRERPRAVLMRWAVPAAAAALLVAAAFGVMRLTPPREAARRAPMPARVPVSAPHLGREADRATIRELESVAPPAEQERMDTAALDELPAPSAVPSAKLKVEPEATPKREPGRTPPARAVTPSIERGAGAAGPPPPPAPLAVRPSGVAAEPKRKVAPSAEAPKTGEVGAGAFYERAARPAAPTEEAAGTRAHVADQMTLSRDLSLLEVSAEASETQVADGRLTLQLKTDRTVENARVSLRFAETDEGETVLWEGTLEKSKVNMREVHVPRPRPGSAGAQQQVVVSGPRLDSRAYYVFAPSAPGRAAAPPATVGARVRGKPENKRAALSGTWNDVLQAAAFENGVYILAPADFPVREQVPVAAPPPKPTLPHALNRIGYGVRQQKGAWTIEPVPGRESAPRRAGRSRR